MGKAQHMTCEKCGVGIASGVWRVTYVHRELNGVDVTPPPYVGRLCAACGFGALHWRRLFRVTQRVGKRKLEQTLSTAAVESVRLERTLHYA